MDREVTWALVDQWVEALYAAIVTERDESLRESLRPVVAELLSASETTRRQLQEEIQVFRERDASAVAIIETRNQRVSELVVQLGAVEAEKAALQQEVERLLNDHGMAMEFVREIANPSCEWGCSSHPEEPPCLHCRAAAWLHGEEKHDKLTALQQENETLRKAMDALIEKWQRLGNEELAEATKQGMLAASVAASMRLHCARELEAIPSVSLLTQQGEKNSKEA